MSAVVTKDLLHDPVSFARSRKAAKKASTARPRFGLIGLGLGALVKESLPRAANDAARDAATELHIEAIKPRRKTFWGGF